MDCFFFTKVTFRATLEHYKTIFEDYSSEAKDDLKRIGFLFISIYAQRHKAPNKMFKN